MADSKLTALTAASALDGTELLYGSQGGASRKITTAQVQTLARTFRGAKVQRTTNLTGLDLSTLAAMDFDTEIFDTDGIWDTGTSTTNLVVPAGVSYVEVGGGVRANSGLATGLFEMYFQYNEALLTPGPAVLLGPNATNGGDAIYSGPVAVAAGGRFRLMFRWNGDTSVNLVAAHTFFWMKVLA